MSVKITSLELENVKRVKTVTLEPKKDGLTVIGGNNKQGKTSILDAIAYGLGGEKRRPTNLQRVDGVADAKIDLKLSNGLRVTRSGKNAALKVIDPEGKKGGQKLLDSFIDELALDLPKFLAMTGKEKAAVLLRIIGIGDQLIALDQEERKHYEERTVASRIADQKKKFAAELPEHHDVPELPVTAAELVAETQAVMRRNAERQNNRSRILELEKSTDAKAKRAEEIRGMLAQALSEHADLKLKLDAAKKTPLSEDESTADIEAKINDIENLNAKVRANMDKAKAVEDAAEHDAKAKALDRKVEEVRERRRKLLEGAEMPLPGLSVDNGELTYHGKAWDCMSGVEKIRASVAIVRKLKPECGFVLLDQLEAFDLTELEALGEWLQAEGLQAIATRVSTGDECSIIIEDGMVKGQKTSPDVEQAEATQPETAKEEEW